MCNLGFYPPVPHSSPPAPVQGAWKSHSMLTTSNVKKDWKASNSSLIHKRGEDTGQTANSKIEEASKWIQFITAYWSRDPGVETLGNSEGVRKPEL